MHLSCEIVFYNLIVVLVSFHLTFFCCWLSNARSKRRTLEISKLSLQNEFKPSVRSSSRDWRNTQPNFTVLIMRCTMFSGRKRHQKRKQSAFYVCFFDQIKCFYLQKVSMWKATFVFYLFPLRPTQQCFPPVHPH